MPAMPEKHCLRGFVLLFLLNSILMSLTLFYTTAQDNQCNVVTTINYPVDTNTFQLVQGYGVASPRHQGRFHTGEDWSAGMNATIGTPVRAAATGRVTYSGPTGWGRDGGVVIIEHTMPDDTVFYTQYGHIVQTDATPFPTRLSCVEAGEVIGAIGDVRPAPHLHFEVRVDNGDTPGAGYLRGDLTEAGWRRPSQVIRTAQLQLNPAYEWHSEIEALDTIDPPLVLNNGGLMLIDGDTIRRLTPDGRLLWRNPTERPAVSITGFQGLPLVFYADGTVGRVDLDGLRGVEWEMPFQPDLPPIEVDNLLLFHTVDNRLVLISENRREVVWEVEGIPAYDRALVTSDLIALVTDDALWLVSRDGALISEAQLREGADMTISRDGTLLVYSHGGLWEISAAGVWSEYIESVPPGGGSSAVVSTEDGRVFLTDGENVYAYNRLRSPDWQAELPAPVTGQVSLDIYDGVLLITSNNGHMVTLREVGGICGFATAYGYDRAGYWHILREDGTLRFMVGNQIIALDWQRFTGGC